MPSTSTVTISSEIMVGSEYSQRRSAFPYSFPRCEENSCNRMKYKKKIFSRKKSGTDVKDRLAYLAYNSVQQMKMVMDIQIYTSVHIFIVVF